MKIQTSGRIPVKHFRLAVNNHRKSAEVIKLVYVSDTQPGIRRTLKNGRFHYTFNDQKVTNKADLQRIKSLVIPPAWTDVWICPDPAGHMQVTGRDARGRKQYLYHPDWTIFRNQTKFYRMIEFGDAIPQIRAKLEKDLAIKELCEEKVLATVVSLMAITFLRVGNSSYEKQNGSYGLTTLKDKHVNINGDKMVFTFRGKKGVGHSVTLKSRRLARVVQQCRDIPGRELFQFRNSSGEIKSIDSGKVNAYIKNITGKEFTAKDFRTWAGTVCALRTLKEMGECEEAAEKKRRVVEMMKIVSRQLGNTPAVCKKYYVNPLITDLYEQGMLSDYFKHSDESTGKHDLDCEEKIIMEILKNHHK